MDINNNPLLLLLRVIEKVEGRVLEPEPLHGSERAAEDSPAFRVGPVKKSCDSESFFTEMDIDDNPLFLLLNVLDAEWDELKPEPLRGSEEAEEDSPATSRCGPVNEDRFLRELSPEQYLKLTHPFQSPKGRRQMTRTRKTVFDFFNFFQKPCHASEEGECNSKNKVRLTLPSHDNGVLDQRSEKGPQKASKAGKKRPRKLRKQKRHTHPDLAALKQNPPDMPEEFKNLIGKLGGSKLALVITKQIFWTDVSGHHLRFLIGNGLRNFLRDEEKKGLADKQRISVMFIEPFMKDSVLELIEWRMSCTVYALVRGWNQVVCRNGIKENDIVQLWCFRVESRLCMALIKVRSGGEI